VSVLEPTVTILEPSKSGQSSAMLQGEPADDKGQLQFTVSSEKKFLINIFSVLFIVTQLNIYAHNVLITYSK